MATSGFPTSSDIYLEADGKKVAKALAVKYGLKF